MPLGLQTVSSWLMKAGQTNLAVVVGEAMDKIARLEHLEEVSECPPDCALTDWIKGYPAVLHDANEMRVKVQRLDAVILKLKREIHSCETLEKARLDRQGRVHSQRCREFAERILEIAKGESDE